MHLAVCSIFFLTAPVVSETKSQGEKEVSRFMQKYASGEFDSFLKKIHEEYLVQKEDKLKEITDSIQHFSHDLHVDALEKEVADHVKKREQELKKVVLQYPDSDVSKAIQALFSEQDHDIQRYFYSLETKTKKDLTPLETKLQEIMDEYFNKNLLVSVDYITNKIDLKHSLELHFALDKEQVEAMHKAGLQFEEPAVRKKLDLYRDSFLKRSAQKIDVHYLRELEKGNLTPSNKAEERAKEILKSAREEMNKVMQAVKKESI